MDTDLLCFSHLRWDFVYQRPNHLMTRAARTRRVFFVEESRPGQRARLDFAKRDGVTVVTPRLRADLPSSARLPVLRDLMTELVEAEAVSTPVAWYYTPMSFAWSSHLRTSAVVYDIMDELSTFRGAPPELVHLEKVLLARADVAFTGGRQLFEAKRAWHSSVHLFPSSVDVSHFRRARTGLPEPLDQASIGRPRLGYFGVIDERIDRPLLRELAERRPDWQIVLVGPVAKLRKSALPQAPNIHYLGLKDYAELPAYLAGWDVAIMPFALSEATRYISPTKTPEYLAGGRPVASTPIRDVVDPYGITGLVNIGDGAVEFEHAVEAALATDVNALRRRSDALLAQMSWDRTWAEMERLVATAVARNTRAAVSGGIRMPAARAAVAPTALGGRGASPISLTVTPDAAALVRE